MPGSRDHGGPFLQWAGSPQKKFPARTHAVSRTQRLPKLYRIAHRSSDRADSSGNHRRPPHHSVRPKTFYAGQSNQPPQWVTEHRRNTDAGSRADSAYALSRLETLEDPSR